MAPTAKTVRTQLARIKPILSRCSLESTRRGQDLLGELIATTRRDQVLIKPHDFPRFSGAWILPKDHRRQGVILYLHGGGYTCGSLDYAKGFGSALADECGTRVFCCAYRLAPEHPFPAAVEDALESYQYLLNKGYTRITLCGESAGGGLCYALCLRLKELGLPLPRCILAISPWTDLTMSGASCETNVESDPTLTKAILDYYAGCYTDRPENPLASPLFGDLEGLPPSLIFAGGEELLLSDAENLHEKLLRQGCQSHLTVAPERWHGYILYQLEEDRDVFTQINTFLDAHMARADKLRWVRLDNAAKIYPAARSRRWSNMFRLSATLTEPVDAQVLQSALDVTVRRFPTIAARLRRGAFWYYLQQLSAAPKVQKEYSYPLAYMHSEEARKCAFRVIAYKNRIAVEFFHSLTDGNGGLIFLKTLTAEYLQQKYGVHIPAEQGVLGRLEEPSPAEMEDSFLKYAGSVSGSRRDTNAWHFQGTREPDGRLNLICLQLNTREVVAKAHEYGITVTGFLCAALMQAIQNLQAEKVPNVCRRKPVKVLIPVNLRKLFPSKTLRNFALYCIPELDPRLGDYDFSEICKIVQAKMSAEITPKQMSKMIATNVSSERLMAVRIMPLPIKNLVMKAVFHAVGERKSFMSLSNLGAVELPEEMKPYVQRIDMILGAQAAAPHNCGVVSYNGTLYMNFIRNIKEADLEYHFYRVLRELGLSVRAESNQEE